MARLLAFASALFAVQLGLAAGQTDKSCSSHGKMDDDTGLCVCVNPTPGPGEKGWVGPNCEIDVYGAYGDGRDETSDCKDSNGCNKLESDEMRCWSMAADFNSRLAPWNYLTAQLNRTSEHGDPDLYGMFWGGFSGQGRVLSKQGLTSLTSYDFEETSSSLHPLVSIAVNKDEDIGRQFDYSGVYMCVHAYGGSDATFSLRASVTPCPSNINENGQVMMCSTPVSDPTSVNSRFERCVEGTCQCRERWSKPSVGVYEGLGFEDCSTEVVSVETGSYKWFPNMEVSYRGWTFFKFNITDDDYEVVMRATAQQADSQGAVSIFLKSGTPPSNRYGQFDARSESPAWMASDWAEVKFNRASDGWRHGTWYAGVHNNGVKSSYIFEVVRYNCPSNCNGRGTCKSDHTCECQEDFFMHDCSGYHLKMEFDREISTTSPREFEASYFKLPAIDAGSSGHVEVTVTVKAWADEDESHYIPVVPILLLKGGDDADGRASEDDFATLEDYDFKRELTSPHEPYSVTIASSMLKGKTWTAVIYNPVESVSVGYSILATKQSYCPNACSSPDQGTCNADGVCECKTNWMGLDCSLPAGSCTEGSFREQRRDEDLGTCWQKCVCYDGHCGYQRTCSDFTCFKKDELLQGPKKTKPDPSRLRRVPDQDKCVEDECMQDQVFQDVEAGDTCTKRCVCDGGFGQCKLQESCEIGTKHCLKGTDCSAGTHEDDEETPLPSKSVAGVPVWAVVVAVVGSALFGSCAMMLMVISRDMRNGNSLHSKLYSGIDMEDMEKSDMLAECNEDLLTSEVHQSP